MAVMKKVLGVLVLFLLASTVFSDVGLFPQANLLESSVVITPTNADGTLLNLSVISYAPATTSTGVNDRTVMAKAVTACQSDPNPNACLMRYGLSLTASTNNTNLNISYVQDAQVIVQYFNPSAPDPNNPWTIIPTCNPTMVSSEGTVYVANPASSTGFSSAPIYVGQCDISNYIGYSNKTFIKATFIPSGNQSVSPSSATYEYDNTHISANSQFMAAVTNFINGVSQAGGRGTSLAQTSGQTLPCIGIFLIMGMLLASLYFAGKSPISLLDITTPRLPTPKGVAASGQILAPFGYTEMKKTTKAKMDSAAAALAASQAVLDSRMRSDTNLRDLKSKIASDKGTAADRAMGDVAQGQKVATALVTAGRSLGMKPDELSRLASLPYHYSDAEHKKVAEILQKLEMKGGREAVMAMTLKDYMYGLRTFQSLEVLTAHPDVGQRSLMHAKISGTLNKFYGSNRYAVVSGVVMSGTDSAFRTGRVVGRMTKAIFKELPPTIRATARTTMEMMGGRVEDLEARGKTSPTAAWMAGQLTKHPSQVIVGAMYPINDKMAHLYRALRNEAMYDEMRYVLKQVYKKYNLKMNLSAEEMANMGHIDMDILKRSNYVASAELAAAEAEIRKILSNTTFSSVEKLNALTALAEKCGVEHRSFEGMNAFNTKVQAIEQSAEPEHMKLISLQAELEKQNKVRTSTMTGGHVRDDVYLCHVGGDSIKGSQAWETMVLRTMIWDAENGFLKGGVKEELVSARLNMANRLASLDPSSAMDALPEHMRNTSQLQLVAERNRTELLSLFTEAGKTEFAKFAKLKYDQAEAESAMGGLGASKSAGEIRSKWASATLDHASIAQIVDFMQGGATPRTGQIDPKTGRMYWWGGADFELPLSQKATLVDVKRHWVADLNPRENFAIGQWVESRFTRSYSPAFNAAIEAELNRMPGSASWSVEQRTQMAKKIWISEQLLQDMESRFNSQFAQNTYGTTRETSRLYTGILAGFMEKALQEKGMEPNHPDMRFIQTIDTTNPNHLKQLNELMRTYKNEYQKVVSRDMTYDDIAKSNKAVVMLHEGGYAYYKKGMMLSDMDRVMAGESALRDNKGVLRKFIPEEIPIDFGNRGDLNISFSKVQRSKDTTEWAPFIQSAITWAKEGGYNYEKEKVLGHVLWQYSNATHDYERFWKDSAVSVEAKRQVTPVAPNSLRFFGIEGDRIGSFIKPFRDIAMHGGDYVSKVALASGGSLLRTSYDITPVSSIYRQHSLQLASKILSNNQIMEDLSDAEKVAYRNVAIQHGAYHQVWDYAIDRNPWRGSTSFGTPQSWASFFHFGPAIPFNVRQNLRSYMDKGEYAGFMSLYGFPMQPAKYAMMPFVNMLRGMQMSMQGYASRWDSTGDALRQWNYTEPRVLEAMQSMNPFSFKWFPGKNSERLAKLNMVGGSLERHQLAGHEYIYGLSQAPQDIFLQRKGVYASARTGEVNPGESIYNYRMEMKPDAPMAEYLVRSKEAAFMYDKDVQEAAMNNTVRRTVSAEALAIRRDQELRGFGVMQNSLFGWANPLMFLWHMPVPIYPQSATPKEILGKMVARSKGHQGESFGDRIAGMAENLARGTSKLVQPHKISMVVYCPKCGMSNYRGSVCKNLSCRQVQY